MTDFVSPKGDGKAPSAGSGNDANAYGKMFDDYLHGTDIKPISYSNTNTKSLETRVADYGLSHFKQLDTSPKNGQIDYEEVDQGEVGWRFPEKSDDPLALMALGANFRQISTLGNVTSWFRDDQVSRVDLNALKTGKVKLEVQPITSDTMQPSLEPKEIAKSNKLEELVQTRLDAQSPNLSSTEKTRLHAMVRALAHGDIGAFDVMVKSFGNDKPALESACTKLDTAFEGSKIAVEFVQVGSESRVLVGNRTVSDIAFTSTEPPLSLSMRYSANDRMNWLSQDIRNHPEDIAKGISRDVRRSSIQAADRQTAKIMKENSSLIANLDSNTLDVYDRKTTAAENVALENLLDSARLSHSSESKSFQSLSGSLFALAELPTDRLENVNHTLHQILGATRVDSKVFAGPNDRYIQFRSADNSHSITVRYGASPTDSKQGAKASLETGVFGQVPSHDVAKECEWLSQTIREAVEKQVKPSKTSPIIEIRSNSD